MKMSKHDLITKDYALYIVHYYASMLTWSKKDILAEIDKKIKESAPIDPESLRPQGEWIHEGDGWDECWKCSACKEYFAFEYDPTDEETFVKYCPDCGAKMKKDGDA